MGLRVLILAAVLSIAAGVAYALQPHSVKPTAALDRFEGILLHQGGEPGTVFLCSIVFDHVGPDYERGRCFTYVAGPYLYSIEELKTAFGICFGRYPSAVSLESFYSYRSEIAEAVNPAPNFRSEGKRLVPAAEACQCRDGISFYSKCETPELTGNSRVRIYFYVEFVYERFTYCGGLLGICRHYYRLYPSAILNVSRADQIGAGYVEPYTPPNATTLYYAYRTYGNAIISFLKGRGFFATIEKDAPLVGTNINFTHTYGSWSATLTVNFHQTSIYFEDDRYSTPYIRVSASPWVCYYWWERDHEKANYEILFAPCS